MKTIQLSTLKSKNSYMNTAKLIITSVVYLLIGVLEAYSYYLFRCDAIGVLAFFTLCGFMVTFYTAFVYE